ncbi:nucleotidyltransferase domain-containing protein [Lyngbya sp. CCY1209]|uniref:nucleotidyltransferase family protein n=1 Tax=Lyngbya sp. CCY1209 TaxID=2886103 RepID=UPI002D217808|nr:nucleotidyltransferase domain-containing protein [Lyngbya sp. CCY1209]MEB3886969.1 nucleotidyltransferase domain-containing protein [Lyngbya sp. CCY1209]
MNIDAIEQRLGISLETIKEFCQNWKIQKLDLFGSVLRDDFTDESDIDFLVTFDPEAKVSLFDLEEIENQLAMILKREVDIVSRKAIEILRQSVHNLGGAIAYPIVA